MPTASETSEALQEYVDSRGESLRVEPQSGVLRGVKLLGVASRNGRRYPDAALRRAMPLYEGAKVNVNHPKGDPLSPRDYQDRIGVIRNVEFRPGAGLFGVLHFNPHHPLAEQLAWDSENAPENVGLSHNVLARTSRKSDGEVVDEITKVQSVDLVADPATTRGLFEQRIETAPTESPTSEPANLQSITLEELEAQRPDLVESATEPLRRELTEARAQADRLAAREAAFERRQRVEKTLSEHGLPLPGKEDSANERLVSQDFLRLLLEATSDAEVDRLVKDRAEAIKEATQWRPNLSPAKSREQAIGHGEPRFEVADAASFVAAITR